MKKEEHQDLEQPFQISINIDFNDSNIEYEGLNKFEVKIKKKKEKKIIIENVKFGKQSKGSLF